MLSLWELLFVGLPVALIFGVGGYLWWRSLPEDVKDEFKCAGTDAELNCEKSRERWKKSYGSGGFGFFMFTVSISLSMDITKHLLVTDHILIGYILVF